MSKELRIALPEAPIAMQRLSASYLVALLSIAILVRWEQPSYVTPGLYEKGLAFLAIFWSAWLIYKPFRIRFSFVIIPLTATVIWPLLQLITHQTISPWETENAALSWFANLLSAFFGLQLSRTVEQRHYLLRNLAYFAFAITVISLLQYFSAPRMLFWLFSYSLPSVFGPFISRNTFAEFAELVLPIFVAFAVRPKNGHPLLWVGMAASVFAAVIASASRAGTALIVIEVVILVVAVATTNKGAALQAKSRSTILIFALVATLFTAIVGTGRITARLFEKDPYFARREMSESSLDMIRAKPLMGFGLGNFVNIYGSYSKFETDKLVDHAHDDWAEWGADGGIPFVAFVAVLAGWLAPRSFRSVWGVGILVVLMHASVDFPLQDPPIGFWLFTLTGLLGNSLD